VTTAHAAPGDLDTGDRAERAARPWVKPLGRFGLATRGALYAVVGMLAVRVAFGQREEADRKGALAAVARQPFGRLLLVLIAVGFAGYALWRFAQGLLDTDDKGSDAKGLANRVGYVGRGALYAAFCYSAVRFVMGASDSAGGARQQVDWTARLLEKSYGQFLVIVAGLVVIGVGLYSGYRAVTKKYRKQLKNFEMGPTTDRWVSKVAFTGLVGRMSAFVLVGVFVIKAAVEHNPQEAAGLDGALRNLLEARVGELLVVLVGVGLVVFGCYSLVEARYRKVMEV
jgi:hypothetical protein